MHSEAKPMDPPAADEIITTRVFPFPRAVVFRAFTDATTMAAFWGPKGFTNTFQKFEPRPGGQWRFVMHGPDGTDYPNETDFVEVVAPERIVIDHLRPMHRFQITMTFAEESDGTRLTWRMKFESAAELERVRKYVVPANEENFDRLAAVLAGRQ